MIKSLEIFQEKHRIFLVLNFSDFFWVVIVGLLKPLQNFVLALFSLFNLFTNPLNSKAFNHEREYETPPRNLLSSI